MKATIMEIRSYFSEGKPVWNVEMILDLPDEYKTSSSPHIIDDISYINIKRRFEIEPRFKIGDVLDL